jgi:hypothetical protein
LPVIRELPEKSFGTITTFEVLCLFRVLPLVAMIVAADPDTMEIDYFYLNGMKTPPDFGVKAANVRFTMPITPGRYEFRFFDDTFRKLAISPLVVIK